MSHFVIELEHCKNVGNIILRQTSSQNSCGLEHKMELHEHSISKWEKDLNMGIAKTEDVIKNTKVS